MFYYRGTGGKVKIFKGTNNLLNRILFFKQYLKRNLLNNQVGIYLDEDRNNTPTLYFTKLTNIGFPYILPFSAYHSYIKYLISFKKKVFLTNRKFCRKKPYKYYPLFQIQSKKGWRKEKRYVFKRTSRKHRQHQVSKNK